LACNSGSGLQAEYGCTRLLEMDLTREERGAIYTRLCWIADQNEQWSLALDWCKRGNDPLTSVHNYVNLGVADYATGNYGQALKDFTLALGHVPEGRILYFIEVPYNLGSTYEKLKDRKAAIAYFKIAKEGCGMYKAKLHYKALIRFKNL
jgi:tetratricopeptide (TPR) repeat protein